ncbi:MAG: acetylglutamate kinase [Bacillota bacterium]|jgi:acetylglutamate kinase|nr:acetylglutamate kinase [Bacillota bacterium]MDI9414978.1 acetylglutamate kinase [Bacillota bacterium]NLD12079.1 acetylglutamate kinase [Bacillota bacterium]HAV21387.1 acetylglutamate kinase [Bacillota bacterium]HCD41047.1 acetylglutamate kinase [Bacillota bacterium]
MDCASERAGILVEALPYIRAFFGKTIVIKYGGSAMTDPGLRQMVAVDITLLRYVGMNPVVVHGGGKEISDLMKRLGKEPAFVNGLRVTDAETVEIAEMVLTGKINKEIVSLINQSGGKAVGLSGKDAFLITASKVGPEICCSSHEECKVVDLGHVGNVQKIDPAIIDVITGAGFIPVISPVATDAGGITLNINADHLAGSLASALNAYKLIMLTDVEGIMADPSDMSSLIEELTIDEVDKMVQDGRIVKGMIPKVEACITALQGGVERTHIIDGRRPHSLLLEMFTDKGIGTMIVK